MEAASTVSDINYIQANFNGELCDARKPVISPLDRGFLYGDAIYEVWRTYDGVIFGWEEHWQRLAQTANGIGMGVPFGQEDALRLIRSTTKAWRDFTRSDSELYIRLQISRGAGPIGLDIGLADQANFVFLVKAQAEIGERALNEGIRLHVSEKWKRNASDAMPPALKTGNYLNNILGLTDAKANRFDDVLFLNQSGCVTEASTRNVWFVFKDRIATPPVEDGILAGVTRRLILENFEEFDGLPLVVEAIRPQDLLFAKECFLTSSTLDVQPVASVDEHVFATGVDSVTRKLKREFAQFVSAFTSQNRDALWV